MYQVSAMPKHELAAKYSMDPREAEIVLLNGWTPVDPAHLTVDLVESAAPGRTGIILLEN